MKVKRTYNVKMGADKNLVLHGLSSGYISHRN